MRSHPGGFVGSDECMGSDGSMGTDVGQSALNMVYGVSGKNCRISSSL